MAMRLTRPLLLALITIILISTVVACTDEQNFMPCQRKGHIGIVVNNTLYVMFGSHKHTEYPHDTWKVDLDTLQWNKLTFSNDSETPVGRWKSCGVHYDNSIYVFGGHTGFNSDPFKGYMNDLWRFDLSSETWTLLHGSGEDYKITDHMFGGRRAHSCDVIGHRMLIFGGRNKKDNAYEHLISYNFKKDRFEKVDVEHQKKVGSDLARKGHASAVIEGKRLFVQGGRNELDYKDDAWSFSTKRGEWKEQTGRIPGVQGRNHHTCVYDDHNERVVVFGGRGGRDDTYFNDMLFFDVDEAHWTVRKMKGDESVPTPRFLHSAELVGNKMIIFGGESKDGRLNELWEYDMKTENWTLRETLQIQVVQ